MRSFHYKYPEMADYFLAPFFMHADFLFSGCFMASIFFYNTDDVVDFFSKINPTLVYIVVGITWVFSKFEFHPVYDVIFIPLSGAVLNCCICFLLLYFIVRKESLGYKVLNFPLVTSLGILSYSLYIWQQFFISGIDKWWAQYPQNIFFTFTAAYASYLLVEKPFLKLKETFKPRVIAER
jgi:peptidoglycan/LPS O-acetylase OafA/YrhL